MNIIVIHGDDFLASKNKLHSLVSDARKKGFSIININSEVKLGAMEQLTGQSLFEKENIYVLEGAGKISPKELKWLFSKEKLPGTLIIYHEGFLPNNVKVVLGKDVKQEIFKLPPLIFSFLDSFYPGNSQNAAQLLHRLTPGEPTEKVIHFLGRHLRDLYWVGKDPELLPYKEDWRVLKILSQAKKFQRGQLEKVISELSAADVASKTSDTPAVGLLDQIIVSQLE